MAEFIQERKEGNIISRMSTESKEKFTVVCHALVKTLNLFISRCYLADDVKKNVLMFSVAYRMIFFLVFVFLKFLLPLSSCFREIAIDVMRRSTFCITAKLSVLQKITLLEPKLI